MHGYLKQSTASQTRIIGPFVDDTDFKTAETGLTIANTDIKLSKNGATSVNKNSGGGTHIVNGNYAITLDATDTNTVGELFVSVAVAGALQVVAKFVVLEEAIYDALLAASAAGFDANQRVNVGTWLGTAVNPLVSGDVPANTKQISGDSAAADNAEAFFDGTGYKDVDNLYVLRTGTAQAGAAGTITLDAGASASDDFYNNTIVQIISGTGAGQSRIISDYVGSTKVASVNGNWVTNPDSTSVFILLPFGSIPGASAPTAAEVADAVWDEARSGHVGAGSFGEGVASVQGNVTGNVAGSIGSLGTQAKADVNAEVDAALDTAVPGSPTANSINERIKTLDDNYTAARAPNLDNLDALVSSRATPAQVNTEVDNALADVNLDHLVGTATGIPAIPAGTYLDQIMDDGTATYDRATDSLQAIRDRGDAAWVTGGGGGGSSPFHELYVQREYGVPAVIDGFALFDSSGNMVTNPTLATGDVSVSVDGATPVNIATLPTAPGSGSRVQIQLSASEMTGKRIVVTFIDQAGSQWRPRRIVIDTYGHTLAQHSFNLNSSTVQVGDKTGFRLSATGVNDLLRTALTEGYAANGAAPTLEQFMFMVWSVLAQFGVVSTTINCKKLDGATNSMTFTLDSPTSPTSRTRAT